MTNLLKILYFSWIFWRICEADEVTDDDLITLPISVQKFYSSPSVVLLFDRHIYGFEKEVKLLDIIKSYSRQDRLSQAISFDNLQSISLHRENILTSLYVLVIEDNENLEHSINATKNIDISYHPWLLVSSSTDFDCNAPGKHFFKLRMDTEMAAKCKGDNVLRKYYSIFDDRTEVMNLAVWTSEKKLKFIHENDFMKGQTDMKGITLKVANKTSYLGSNNNVVKFIIELTEELKVLCHFEIEQGPQGDSLGYYDKKTEKWNGLMEIMSNKMADIGSNLFSMSIQRMTAVDYVTPVLRSRLYLYAKIPETTEVHWNAYFKVFNGYAKMAIFISILISTIVLRLMTPSFFENFINVWGIYTLQGLADQPSRNSIKTVYLSILICSLILNLIYSAGFTSYVTVLSPKLPFRTYEEFNRDKIYKVSVVQGDSDYDLIMSGDTLLSPLKSRLKKSYFLPKNSYQAFLQTCNEKVAFYANEAYYEGVKNDLPCELDSVRIQRVEYDSMVLTKSSPYTKAMSYSVMRLRDFGILTRLRNKYFRKLKQLANPPQKQISLKEVVPILAIWVMGLLIALLGLILEIVVFRLSHSVTKRVFIRRRKAMMPNRRNIRRF